MSPDSCVFPYKEKAENSLARNNLVFLINGHLLKFQLVPGLCYKTPYVSWLLPYLCGAAPQRSPQKVHQIKYNSQLLGCAFFQ